MLKDSLSFKKQKGLTFISWVVILSFWGFMSLIVVRMIPAYLEHFSVKVALESLSEYKDVRVYPRKRLQELLARRFQVNQVTNVKASDLDVRKEKDRMILTLDYEIRVRAIANIDAVVHFKDEVVVE